MKIKYIQLIGAAIFTLLPISLHAAPISLNSLLDAIAIVESNNNPVAIGDNGKAVGMYQIWPIMVKDVNRILGRQEYTLEDRLNPQRSRAMCRTYLEHYCKGKSLAYMARCWNGGPNGYKKESTLKYWKKIKEVLK